MIHIKRTDDEVLDDTERVGELVGVIPLHGYDELRRTDSGSLAAVLSLVSIGQLRQRRIRRVRRIGNGFLRSAGLVRITDDTDYPAYVYPAKPMG